MTSATRAEQGWQMLDIFASFGVRAFDLTETDLDGRRRSFRPSQEWKLLGRWRASLLESAAARQDNIIVRPRGGTFELVQLDDLRGAGLECVRSIAFLILATSAGNHQAWVAVRECPADLARRLRQGSGADPSASGAARIAGSVNFKRKYAPLTVAARYHLDGSVARRNFDRSVSTRRHSVPYRRGRPELLCGLCQPAS
jgi:hypothetical protein